MSDHQQGLRILALVTDCYGGRGGIAQYNRDLIEALIASDRVAQVMVLPRRADALGEFPPAGVSQLSPVAGRIRYSLAAFDVAKRRGPFDIVFCGHLYLVPMAALLAAMFRRPLWVQVHGVDAWQRANRWQGRGIARADLVTAVSRYTRERLLQWADVEPGRVRILPNTVRYGFRHGQPKGRLTSKYAFAGQPFVITVSRISRNDTYKGHRRVIDVLPAVRARHPDLHYVIVGDGDDRPELEHYARRAGVGDVVHFLGHVPSVELPDLLSAAQAFVMPSTKEGFGIVYLEAAACGIPVIAGNKDGSRDALADGAIGELIDPDEPAQLLEALSAAAAGRLPIAGADAIGRFAFSNFQRHMEDVLRELLPQAVARRLYP